MNLFTAGPTGKVPGETTTRDCVRTGFFFAFGALLLACAAYAGVKVLSAVLAIIAPFIVGLVFALLLDPLIDRMERKIHRGFAVFIVFLAFVSILTIIALVAVPALVVQASALAANGPIYLAGTKAVVNHFLSHHHKIFTVHLPKNFDVLSAQVTTQLGAFMQRSAGGLTVVLVGSVSTIFDVLVSTIVGFYLLIDIDRLRARLMYLTPEKYRMGVTEFSKDVGQVFSDYLRGLVIVCAAYGVTTTIVLYGMAYFPKFGHPGIAQYALLIGAAAGVLYAIPYLGAFTTAGLTFVVALATGGFEFGIASVLATLVINQTFDNIIAPRVIGGGVGLNPVLALFSLSLGGFLFGFWGLLFSVPIAASIQVVLFRLFPKLSSPTPPAFLIAHGVPPDKGETAQVRVEPTEALKEHTAVNHAIEQEKTAIEVAAENAEAPG